MLPNERSSLSNPLGFIVNPYTSVIYVEHLIIDNAHVLTEGDIIDLMITQSVVEVNEQVHLALFGFSMGDYILKLVNQETSAILTEYRVNPLTGDVYSYPDGYYITKLIF